MMRLAMLSGAAALMLLGACSLIVDLEPDCDEVSSCGAYACNDANTACRDSCASDLHCGPGHGCSLETGTCEWSGCDPLADAPLALDGVHPSFETFRASTTLGGVALVLEHPRGIFLSRMRENSRGELSLIADSADPELGAFVVFERDVPEGRERQFARVGLLANSVSELGDNRLMFAWRIFDGQRFLLRSFRIERIDGQAGTDAGPRPRSQVNFHTQRRGELLGDLLLLPRPQGASALWHEPSGTDSDRLVVMALDGRLDSEGGESVELGDRAVRDIRGVAANRVAGRTLVAFTGTDGGGVNRVVTRFYRDDVSLSASPEVVRVAGGSRTEAVAIGPAGGSAWLLWSEGQRLMELGLDALGAPRSDRTAVEVAEGMDVAVQRGLRSASRLNDFVVAFAAERGDATGLWLARVDENGVAGMPFPVGAEALAEEIVAFDVFPNTVGGFSAVWLQERDGERTWWYRPWVCSE